MRQYNDIVKRILSEGTLKEGRNGNTLSVFNVNYEHRLDDGFPVLTTKKVNWKAAIYELLWYLSGETHIRNLQKHTKVWNLWADANGDVPSPYGFRWRNWATYDAGGNDDPTDQLAHAIKNLKSFEGTRRAVVIAWDPYTDVTSSLPPCHFAFVFNMQGDELNLHLSQRSCDVAVGLPFNMIAYSALLIMVAQLIGKRPGRFAHSIVDAHIYEPHVEAIREQIGRRPKLLPQMMIARKGSIDDYTYESMEQDFQLTGYNPYPAIKYEVLV